MMSVLRAVSEMSQSLQFNVFHSLTDTLTLIADSVLTRSDNINVLLLSCHVSEILELLYAESHFFCTPPLFGRKFRDVFLGVDP